MKLTINFTPLGLKPQDITGKPVLVIDVLRCTTTIVEALANGARAVLPTATAEDALRIAQNLEKDAVLLSCERRLETIPGFALGNSPLEMTPEVVEGKTIVMATTNGTGAIVAESPGALFRVLPCRPLGWNRPNPLGVILPPRGPRTSADVIFSV